MRPPRRLSPVTNTSQFEGVNWARVGDNFSTGPLVPQGLDISDSYQTVWIKSQAMVTAFQHVGANTVRLPINPATVNTNAAIGPDSDGAYDNFDVQRPNPYGANTPLSSPNTTGLDRLQYGWGIGSGSPTTTLRGEPGQQWTRTSTGQITVDEGAECLDAYAGGTSDGTVAGVYPCDGGTNEQWTFYIDGTMELQDCSDGVNQQWKTV